MSDSSNNPSPFKSESDQLVPANSDRPRSPDVASLSLPSIPQLTNSPKSRQIAEKRTILDAWFLMSIITSTSPISWSLQELAQSNYLICHFSINSKAASIDELSAEEPFRAFRSSSESLFTF
jgi:hypothetical protein